MNVLDYYFNYFNLKYPNSRLVEDEYESFIDYSHTNLYLYLFEDQIQGLEKITISKQVNKYTHGAYANGYEFLMFIPYNDFMFVLTISTNYQDFVFYKKGEPLVYIQEVSKFLDWMEVDELKNKITKAFEFLAMNSRIMNDDLFIIEDGDDYVSEYASNIYRNVDHFIHHEDWIYSYDPIYYEVHNKNGIQFYLNTGFNRYTLDTEYRGTLGGRIYYIDLGNKSIILAHLNNWDSTILGLFKDNQILVRHMSLPQIEVLFELINKENLINEMSKYKELL